MDRKKVKFGVIAALFAALVLVFGAATVAKAAVADNPINGVIDQGIDKINANVSGYANLAWKSEPTATGGTIVTTITKTVAITTVKDNIVGTLASELAANSNLVSQVSLSGNTIMGTAGSATLQVTPNVTTAQVTQFAKDCFGPDQYYAGEGINVLDGRSFTVVCTPASGSGAQRAAYTMEFTTTAPTDRPTTPPSPAEQVEAVTGPISAAIENGVGTDAKVTPPTAVVDGALTWEVGVINATATVDEIGPVLVGNVLSGLNTSSTLNKGATATSVDDPTIPALQFDTASATDIDDFAITCLKAAAAKSASSTQANEAPVAISNLAGKTCTIKVQFNETTSTDYVFSFANDETQAAVYRLYNPYDYLHLYTTDANEFDVLTGLGWNDEGVAWNAPLTATGNTPVYRLYNNFNGDHYYTTNKTEADGLVALFPNGEGWAYDNGAKPIFYSCPANGNGIYQLFNQYREVDTHIWTANKLEYDTCQEQGWTGENIKFYALSIPK